MPDKKYGSIVLKSADDGTFQLQVKADQTMNGNKITSEPAPLVLMVHECIQ